MFENKKPPFENNENNGAPLIYSNNKSLEIRGKNIRSSSVMFRTSLFST